MKARTARMLLTCAMAGSLLLDGCDSDDASSCTVVDNGDGGATIQCTDGTSATIENGEDGTDGTNGSNGSVGATGPVGAEGSSCSVRDLGVNAATIECDDGTSTTLCGSKPQPSHYRSPCQTARDQVALAGGLSVSYATREIANWADQISFLPNGSTSPTHMAFCIEGSREDLGGGKLNPSVQVLDLETNEIHTVVRGLTACDGIRTTPWGTLLVTEEFGTVQNPPYELLYDATALAGVTFTVNRPVGQAETISVTSGSLPNGRTISDFLVKREQMPSIGWEGIGILPSGVVYGGDELRPGSTAADADGGALFKFIPSTLRTATGNVTALSQSPLVGGSVYALQVSCQSSTQQVGQGCEVGKGAWVPVSATTARTAADAAGATGYYRPEDLHIDPTYMGTGARFCFANTGERGSSNYGEILCAVDTSPTTAPTGNTARTTTINRFLEGDAELNQPDNLEFHPTTGVLYVIEDNPNGDVWACLPDGADRDIKSDGCVRVLSVKDASAEPTGFLFTPDGLEAYLVVQHSNDGNMPKVDGYGTDDLLHVTGFVAPTASAVAAFGTDTQAALESSTAALFGFSSPAAQASSTEVSRASTFPGGVAPSVAANGFGTSASGLMTLAGGLTATFLTRIAAQDADQGAFYPYGSANPTHLLFCIEGDREDIDGQGKMNPSVQAIDLANGNVTTIVRGMTACDGIRTTPWGTVLITEEFTGAVVHEMLWDPATLAGVTFTVVRATGQPQSIVVSSGVLPQGTTVADFLVARPSLVAISWEGIGITPTGVVYGGDELRPGSSAADSDGGALFKFIPQTLRNVSGGFVTSLAQSPLVAGTNYALQVSCVNNTQTYGQGCEIGNGRWIAITDPSMARPQADSFGATGYYRPEDLHLDPNYTGVGVRFCWANTGSASASNYGEVICGVDSAPDTAPSTRSVVVNRFVEGDATFNQPDNLEFQVGTGAVYVIEDNGFGDIWACLRDGDDRDLKTDGCVRLLQLRDSASEPTGFLFHPAGDRAYFVVQHSADPANAKVDDYNTDDLIVVSGFQSLTSVPNFGGSVATRLVDGATSLFGIGTPLAASATQP